MVTVIDRDSVDRSDPSTVGDLFRGTPGVFFDGGPRRSGQVPSIRRSEGENVQVRIDGARQNLIRTSSPATTAGRPLVVQSGMR